MRAARDGLDVVVVLGGDGTVNEVVNGLLTDGPRPERARRSPSSPAACTNVFARALGLPATRSRRPARCSTRCGTGRTRADRPRPGRRPLVHLQRRHRLGRRGGAPGRAPPAGRRGRPATPATSGPRSRSSSRHRPAAPGADVERPGAGAGRRLHLAMVDQHRPVDLPGGPAGAAEPGGVLRHRPRPLRPAVDADGDDARATSVARCCRSRRCATAGCSAYTTWRSSLSVPSGRPTSKSTAIGSESASRCGSGRCRTCSLSSFDPLQ